MSAIAAVEADEAISVNTQEQLDRMNKVMLKRLEGSKSQDTENKQMSA